MTSRIAASPPSSLTTIANWHTLCAAARARSLARKLATRKRTRARARARKRARKGARHASANKRANLGWLAGGRKLKRRGVFFGARDDAHRRYWDYFLSITDAQHTALHGSASQASVKRLHRALTATARPNCCSAHSYNIHTHTMHQRRARIPIYIFRPLRSELSEPIRARRATLLWWSDLYIHKP